MANNKVSFGGIAAFFLTLFFSGIVIFTLFTQLNIREYDTCAAVITFTIINLIILILVVSCGIPISRIIGGASYAVIGTVTVFYSIIQFIHMGISYKKELTNGYILFQLILLFLYLLIIVPIAIMGTKNKN